MLTGISYSSLFKTIYGKHKKHIEYSGLSFEKILRILSSLGVSYRLSFDKKDMRKSKRNVMVVVDYGESPDDIFFEHSRHAVIWNAETKSVIDPVPASKRKLEMTNSYCTKNFSFLIEVI